jgi:hypothetical protein
VGLSRNIDHLHLQDMIRSRATLLVVALWASVLDFVGSTAAETCEAQSKCIEFHVELVNSDKCGLKVADCPVQICLIFDLLNDCARSGSIPRQMHYACDNAGADQCPRANPWNRASTPGASVDFEPSAPGACQNTKASNEGCTPLANADEMCQVGKPGDYLYWTMYVASQPCKLSKLSTQCE